MTFHRETQRGRAIAPGGTLSNSTTPRTSWPNSRSRAPISNAISPPPENPPGGIEQLAQGDTAFFSGDIPFTILRSGKDGLAESSSDPSREKFGSEHSSISHFAFLDGHVQVISHEIDTRTIQLLTSIGDGNAVSAGQL